MMRRSISRLGTAAVAMLVALPGAGRTQDLNMMDRARAVYAKFDTYTDSGTVLVESGIAGGGVIVERFTFRTAFKRPRQYLFEFVGPDDRVALWCETKDGDFHSWWKATGVHDVYGNRTGINAFLTTAAPTKGTSLYLVSLLLPQTELLASLWDLKPTRAVREDIGGRVHVKLTGEMKGHFGSGRPIAVWIDAETSLLRRIVEDTPAESPAGSVDRVTTNFLPRANPPLSESTFRYRVPGTRQ